MLLRAPAAPFAGPKPATPTAAAPLPAPIVQVRMVVVGRNNSTAEVAPVDLTFRQAAGKLGA
jgi:hypothetical protein